MTTIPPRLHFPLELDYLLEHDVWARWHDDGTATVGITSLGIKLSGEIYMCRAKPVGTVVEQGRAVAVVELAKAIVSVKSAVGGEIVQVNLLLENAPELVHRDPYGEGWVARIAIRDGAHDRERLVRGESALEAMLAQARSLERLA